jgi:flagellin
MTSIQMNISALRSLNNQRKAHLNIAESTERISSAKKINKGADDPSGLAISSGMKAQIRGMNTAIQNCQDVISFVRTGEDGMSLVTDMLVQMRNLAVRAANDATLTGSDLTKLNSEYTSLLTEIDRTVKTMKSGVDPTITAGKCTSIYWPGQTILDLMYVVDTTGSMDMNPTRYLTHVKSQLAGFVATLENNHVDWGIGLVDFKDVIADGAGSTKTYAISTDLATAQANVNTMVASGGGDAPESALEGLMAADIGAGWRYAVGTQNYTRQIIVVTDVATPGLAWHDNAGGTYADGKSIYDTINVANTLAGHQEKVHVIGQPGQLEERDMSTITGGQYGDIGNFTPVLAGIQASLISNFPATPKERTLGIQVGPNASDNIDFTFEDCTAMSLGINGTGIGSAASALSTLTKLDTALSNIGNWQQKYGELDNRMNKTINDLTTAGINISSANSNIEDADMAVEAAKYTKNQIIQQGAMASQISADADPANVIDILQTNDIGTHSLFQYGST